MRQRVAMFSRPMGAPKSSTLPVVGSARPASRRSRLVLPAPFGPSTPRHSPGATSRLTLFRARTPSPKVSETSASRAMLGWAFKSVSMVSVAARSFIAIAPLVEIAGCAPLVDDVIEHDAGDFGKAHLTGVAFDRLDDLTLHKVRHFFQALLSVTCPGQARLLALADVFGDFAPEAVFDLHCFERNQSAQVLLIGSPLHAPASQFAAEVGHFFQLRQRLGCPDEIKLVGFFTGWVTVAQLLAHLRDEFRGDFVQPFAFGT